MKFGARPSELIGITNPVRAEVIDSTAAVLIGIEEQRAMEDAKHGSR